MSSTTTRDRQKRRAPQWALTAVLAGLPLALIAMGPAVVADVRGRSLPVYACQIAVAVLVVHIGFSVLAKRSHGGVHVTMRWLLAATALLALPLIWSTDPAAGILAYFNFASGTVGGIAIAVVWKDMQRGYSWIDVGYLVFLIAGVTQLLVRYSSASSVNSLHQSSPMPWGVSSVVAGGLVVAALIVIARSASLGSNRKYAVTVGLVAIGVALLTLTRGAIIAACVGAIFLLWSKAGQQDHNGFSRRQLPPVLPARTLLSGCSRECWPFSSLWSDSSPLNVPRNFGHNSIRKFTRTLTLGSRCIDSLGRIFSGAH